jgi:TolA-binding protein
MKAFHAVGTCVLSAAVALACGCQTTRAKANEEALKEYTEAQARVSAGDYAAAATLLRKYVDANPSSTYRTDALLLLGDCQMALKDYPAAQISYEQAQVKARTRTIDAEAKAGLGTAMMFQKRWTEAAQAYDSALAVSEKDIDAPTVLMYAAKAHIRSGNWNLGRGSLRKLVRGYPDSPLLPEARHLLAQTSDSYSIQVGAFGTRDAAHQMIETLRKNKILGATVVERSYGSTPFAVRVGSFISYERAAAEADRLKSVAPDCFVVP